VNSCGPESTLVESNEPLKPQLPLLKLARFGNTAVPHTGSLRHDQNLIACTGVEGDYDGEQVSFEEAAERLLKSNISCIVCTTPSYTVDRPRWRVFAWFSCELPPADRARMTDRLNGALGGVLAAESWTLSQSFYYGSVNENPSHRVEIVEGEPIDLCEDLDLIAIGRPSGTGPKPNGHDPAGGPVDEAALITAIISGENYHAPKTRLLGKWAHDGVPFMEAERRLFGAFDAVDGSLRDARWAERRADIQRTVAGIYGKEAGKQDDADTELESIQTAVAALTENDVPATESIIERIAAAKLPPLVEAPLIKNIKRLTGIIASAIDKTLKTAKRELQKADRQSVQTVSWAALVSRFDESDEIRPTMSNVALVIRNEPCWRGTVWLDEFALAIAIRNPLPWDDPGTFRPRFWTDNDELAATEWMQRTALIHSVTGKIVFDGVSRVASEHRFHPVRDYLDSLVWDRKPRLDRWLTYYLGAEEADQKYLAAVGPRSLIQAVARIYRPGVKADCCLLLDGEQGTKKSMVLRMLFDPIDQLWFVDEISDLGEKDAALQLRGKWCIEFSELSALRRVDIERTKAFLSRTFDHYRPPYGRVAIDVQRQNVFVGTSNDDEVLRDSTGNRRYWPFRCGAIDTPALWNDRHQLWAEAVHRFRGGEKWHIDEPELIKLAKYEQAKYQETDAWDVAILEYLKIVKAVLKTKAETADLKIADLSVDSKSRDEAINAANTGVTTTEILTEKLGKRLADIENRDQQRVGNILRRLGWRRKQIGKGPMRGKTHFLPPPEAGKDEDES
jgi:predicted P-loop ATPase